jgi:hypothetical protein
MFMVTDTPVTVDPVGIPDTDSDAITPAAKPSVTDKDIVPDAKLNTPGMMGLVLAVNIAPLPAHIVALDEGVNDTAAGVALIVCILVAAVPHPLA